MRTKGLEKKWKIVLEQYPNFDLVKVYNISILKIHRLESIIQLILKLKFTYTKPEVEYGEIWRMPKAYTKDILSKKFKMLPTEFSNIRAVDLLDFFVLNAKENLCEFELEEFVFKKKEHNVKRATKEDLETEW